MGDDVWEDIENHGTAGIHFNLGSNKFPLDAVVGLVSSYDDITTVEGVTIEAATTELRLGLQKTWQTPYGPRPFISGGLTNITAEVEGSFENQSIYFEDTASGFWVRGGLLWTARKFFNFGVDAAYSSAEGTIQGIEGDAGGFHFAFTVGLHFD